MLLSTSPTIMPIASPRTKPQASARSTAPPSVQLEVEVLHSREELARHEVEWAALSRNAAAPNSFYEPWMLLPALEAFGGNARFQFVLIWRTDPGKPKAPRRLIGFFPLEERRGLKQLPIRSLGLWKHMHCFLCTPLLDREYGRAALDAFFEWTREGKRPRIIEFSLVNADGPFQHVLLDVLNARGHVVFQDDQYNRALLQKAASGEKYLDETLSSGNRKELRRQRRRLGDMGALELRTLDKVQDVEAWVDSFLALEAAGWKGKEGTALGSDLVQRRYFQRIARSACERGQLLMLGLFLAERPIAMKCNFLSPPGSFAFKIAFDESLFKFSPGVQLELDNVLEMHGRPELDWMDSCAVSRHFMINRLWRDRRIVQDLWISTGGLFADLAVGTLPLLRALRRFGRRWQETDSSPPPQGD